MANATITAENVRKGDQIRKQIINRNDPRYGEWVTLTVTTVQTFGTLVDIRDTSDETDYLGNPYNGGMGVRVGVAVEVVL